MWHEYEWILKCNSICVCTHIYTNTYLRTVRTPADWRIRQATENYYVGWPKCGLLAISSQQIPLIFPMQHAAGNWVVVVVGGFSYRAFWKDYVLAPPVAEWLVVAFQLWLTFVWEFQPFCVYFWYGKHGTTNYNSVKNKLERGNLLWLLCKVCSIKLLLFPDHIIKLIRVYWIYEGSTSLAFWSGVQAQRQKMLNQIP